MPPVRTGRSLIGGTELFVASLIVCLLIAEWVTRLVQSLQLSEQVRVAGPTPDDWLVPGSVYRQVSSEYEAYTTITDQRYRVPAPRGNPVERDLPDGRSQHSATLRRCFGVLLLLTRWPPERTRCAANRRVLDRRGGGA